MDVLNKWRQAHTESEELTHAGLGVAGPALLHHTFTQVWLLRRRLAGPSPGLNPTSTLTTALCPLTPHTPATWRHTDKQQWLCIRHYCQAWWESAKFSIKCFNCHPRQRKTCITQLSVYFFSEKRLAFEIFWFSVLEPCQTLWPVWRKMFTASTLMVQCNSM